MQSVLEFLESRKICFVKTFVPYYVTAVCCHLANLANKKNQFYMEAGAVPDLRIHMFFIAPPGFCVAPTTTVLMESGIHKAAVDVRVGDRLASINGKPNIVLNKTRSNVDYYELPHGLKCSGQHRVLTKNGWKHAKDLTLKDQIVTAFTPNELKVHESQTWKKKPMYLGYTTAHVTKRTKMYRQGPAVDFTTSQEHYIANNLVVHNSKSFILKVLLSGPTSALGGTELKTTYSGNLTEAGFTGTIRATDDSGEPIITYGAAHDYADYIVGIEEFSALTTAMKQEHSSNLDNALLTALDSGHLVKRLAAGEIRYDTDITLFAASQPTRFDLSSGLGRRFFFVNFIPSVAEKEKLKWCRRNSKGVRGDIGMLKKIGWDVTDVMKRIDELRSVKFTDEFMKSIDTLKVPHYIEPLFERLGIGYTIATTNFGSVLKVDITPELQKLMNVAKEWRTQISRGAEEQQVVRILEAGEMGEIELKDELLDFGLQYGKSEELIGRLVKQKRIKREEGKVCLIG